MAALLLVAGCQSDQTPPATQSVQTSPAIVNAQPVATTRTVVRIKAGSSAPVTDSQGNVWLADQGFSGGDVIERSYLSVTNTSEPEIYLTERYSMESFSWPLPNGNYLVKLYFCEAFEGITEAGQRVFSFNVQGRDFKDFDVWAKAGGPFTAYVETIPVAIKDGRLLITFTSKFENPQINAIELIPQS